MEWAWMRRIFRLLADETLYMCCQRPTHNHEKESVVCVCAVPGVVTGAANEGAARGGSGGTNGDGGKAAGGTKLCCGALGGGICVCGDTGKGILRSISHLRMSALVAMGLYEHLVNSC